MLLLPRYINRILLNNTKRTIMTKSYDLMCSQTNQFANSNTDDKKFIPIYKIPHSLCFIGLNKFKKMQTAATTLLIPSCVGLKILNYLTIEEVLYSSLLGIGLATGFHISSWLLSNNLVVFVYLSEDEQKCRFSYISFWGNRSELFCNVEDVKPIECNSKLDIFNYKIKLNGNKNTFKIILHDATIFNNAKFRKVFGSDVI